MKEINGEWLDIDQAFDKYEKYVKIAALKRFNQAKAYGMEFADVYNISAIGFTKGYHSYDEKFGKSFGSHAFNNATFEILKAFRDTNIKIHVPRTVKESLLSIKKIPNYESKTVDELSFLIGAKKDLVEQAIICINQSFVSSDKQIKNQKGRRIEDYLESAPLDETQVFVEEFFSKLNYKDRQMLKLYLQEHTQSEIAEIFGITQAHVGRILRKKIAKSWQEYAEV
ncbi:sigma-70 family RNA polymerase sigma factor [Shouchella miscanthi]|uniref:sigma-70 family RNA polymerase sigma factor n=1 Tax=Shouchella miscanthi TaxID=2598861 RepID=UPI00119F35FC|nr:sigma-70 family RNA polymerase sigma factor [Shouchella miscanthi]